MDVDSRDSIASSYTPSSASDEFSRLTPQTDASSDPLLSPSIQRVAGDTTPAFELKFLISEELARQVESWAVEHMQRDAFADERNGGSYQTTTLYLDTPHYDVFHRSPRFRRRKYRLRRYGVEENIFLERKSRRGDRVKKRRSDIHLQHLDLLAASSVHEGWCGQWFQEPVLADALRPVCRLTYQRTAFVKLLPDGPVRLTLDHDIRGVPTSDWNLTPVDAVQQADHAGNGHASHNGMASNHGHAGNGHVSNGQAASSTGLTNSLGCHRILPGQVVCEFKFRSVLPNLFKTAIATLDLATSGISKYRRVLTAAGVVGDGSGQNA